MPATVTRLLLTLALLTPTPARGQSAAGAPPQVVKTWGTVRLLDHEGRWQEALDGAFELVWRDGDERGWEGWVPFEDGAWSAELVSGRSYEIVEGSSADIAWTDWSTGELHPGGFQLIEARAQQEPCLVVFDARTGEELDSVTVILDGSVPWHVYPTRSDLTSPWWAAKDSPSPVALERDLPRRDFDSKSYWVRAPGYAWQRVAVDVSRPGEMLVGLEPAGSLDSVGRKRPAGPGLQGNAQLVRQAYTVRAFEDDTGASVARVGFALDEDGTRTEPLSWSFSTQLNMPPGTSRDWLFRGRRYRVVHAGYLPQWIRAPEDADEEIMISFRRGADAHLLFVDGGRPVELEAWGWFPAFVDSAVFLTARHEDPDARVYAQPHGSGPYRVTSDTPGRLRIDVAQPAGYLPVPTIEVDVDLGPPREVVVELERIPSLR